MWVPKLIQSSLVASAFTLALVGFGCVPADRAAPQTDPSAQHADDDDDDREVVGQANCDDDDDDRSARTAGGGTKSSSATRSVAKSDSAVTAPPSLDELPNLEPQRDRSNAARIEVRGSMETTRRPVVPSYKEIPLTPEEKKALGKDRERPDDVLAFYKPQRSVEQGVSTRERDLQVGVGGHGGTIVGVGRTTPRVETFGDAGHYAQSSGLERHVAGVAISVPILVRVGPSFVMQIGWGLPRTGAAQMPYYEP